MGKSPFPKVKKAMNSGIFSNSGAGQKLDPVKRPPKVEAARAEAMRKTRKKGD